MKKYILVIMTAFLLISKIDVYATGSINVSTDSLTITKGQSVTFTISADNAAGNVLIQSSNSNIASVNKSSYFFDTSLGNSSESITVTALNVGTTQINIILDDVGTFSNEELTGTKVITINVVEPVAPQPEVKQNTTTNNNNKQTKEEIKKEEPVQEEIKEVVEEKIEITKFEIVGYELGFDVNKLNYDINILDGVSDLYIVVEGKELDVIGVGKVSILGKDSIEVTVKHKELEKKYTIKLNKIKNSDIISSSKGSSEVKTETKNNPIFIVTTVIFLISTIVLSVLYILEKKKHINK